MPHRAEFEALLFRFEERLPVWIARKSRALREPGAKLVRIPAAGLLIVGGVFSFLPVLGIWMLPLGLLLLAVDLPSLQPAMSRMLRWIERRWPQGPR
ncbi:MAG: hypothetical protein ACOY5F_17115 [Pseudomonadota bacterium]